MWRGCVDLNVALPNKPALEVLERRSDHISIGADEHIMPCAAQLHEGPVRPNGVCCDGHLIAVEHLCSTRESVRARARVFIFFSGQAKEVREGPPRSAKGSMEDMGRYGEIWGDVGRYGEIWGEHTSSCMEVSTRNGLRVIALPSRERLRSSACTAFTPRQ